MSVHESFTPGVTADCLWISARVALPLAELEMNAIRAQGAGGQNVNKVSSAIHLRFAVATSSLPDFYKERLLALKDQRLTRDGVIVIKAQQYRTQEQNRDDALQRLAAMIREVGVVQARRIAHQTDSVFWRRRSRAKTSAASLRRYAR